VEHELTARKIRAEIAHLSAQSDKLMAETRWYPLVVGTALAVALLSLGKFIL
jgi:hypothetical protein